MAIKYTEEQLNSVDKSMLIQMFLNQQEQLEKVSADSFLIIKQIQAIYREEGKLKELSSKERLVQRQVVVKPLVDALFVYLKQHESEVGTEKLRAAFTYALNQGKIPSGFPDRWRCSNGQQCIRACNPRILCR